ncbi:Hypothetical protein D9617_44g039000 [Elsinoe fawcettii]|nr:Hypothetical protein D9617_44g039000 [Elsinoe fawcettii]
MPVGMEEHCRESRLDAYIQHMRGASQAITEELRAHGAGAEEESDESGRELEQFMGLLQRKEAVRKCEQEIADLILAAKKAAAEASRQQVELTVLRKEVEERGNKWHAGEEEGSSVIKSQWEDSFCFADQ